jgi:hypothetical protein
MIMPDTQGATDQMRAQSEQDALQNAQQQAEDKKAGDEIKAFQSLLQEIWGADRAGRRKTGASTSFAAVPQDGNKPVFVPVAHF